MSATPMKRFTRFFPATLARIQAGTKVNLRDKHVKNIGSFDLITDNNGLVKPIPTDQKRWSLPNGCSLRSPFSTTFQEIAENFDVWDANIFIIEQGTKIPKELILLLERGDHFSLQCSRPMPLIELNTRITSFLGQNATCLTRDDYQNKFQAGSDNDCLDAQTLKEN